MASISNPVYLNLVTPTREEAAVVVAILLNICVYNSDAELNTLGKTIGIQEPVRPLLESMGHKLDYNWEEMLKIANRLKNE